MYRGLSNDFIKTCPYSIIGEIGKDYRYRHTE